MVKIKVVAIENMPKAKKSRALSKGWVSGGKSGSKDCSWLSIKLKICDQFISKPGRG